MRLAAQLEDAARDFPEMRRLLVKVLRQAVDRVGRQVLCAFHPRLIVRLYDRSPDSRSMPDQRAIVFDEVIRDFVCLAESGRSPRSEQTGVGEALTAGVDQIGRAHV